ncbi:MAG: GNAT family N-acetyltransferase [Nannocystaceae bacterium]
MAIVDLTPGHPLLDQAAELLADRLPAGWSDLDAAREEVWDMTDPSRVARGYTEPGVDGGPDRLLGWIGALEMYPGHVWELHPLVVRRGHDRRGIGRALVLDLEEQLRRRGVHTVFLGSDDEHGQTSLADVDLWPDPLAHLARLVDRAGHPFGFYVKMGYRPVGVVPDANGPGKPDILLARRIADP